MLYAAERSSLAVAELLVRSGADVNAADWVSHIQYHRSQIIISFKESYLFTLG